MRDYAELVRALWLCGEPTNECPKCPRYGTDNCHGVFKDAANAIEELLEEKAKLENSGKLLVAAFDRLKEKVQKYRHAAFAISETCVDESKRHISPEDAIKKIREHIYYDNTASCSDAPKEETK